MDFGIWSSEVGFGIWSSICSRGVDFGILGCTVRVWILECGPPPRGTQNFCVCVFEFGTPAPGIPGCVFWNLELLGVYFGI